MVTWPQAAMAAGDAKPAAAAKDKAINGFNMLSILMAWHMSKVKSIIDVRTQSILVIIYLYLLHIGVIKLSQNCNE
jgi:hypothetical protein